MKELRISPEVLRKHVHQALKDEFGDNAYICWYDSEDLSSFTATISDIEERIVLLLIKPFWYAFPTSSDDFLMVKFDACFLDETELRLKIYNTLHDTINRIAQEESTTEEDETESNEE